MQNRESASKTSPDLMMSKEDREELERFKKAAKAFVKKHAASKEAAQKYLVETGILNKEGTLTREYQS